MSIMSFFKKYKKKFVAKLRQLRKYYRYKVYFPKKYESYCNQPVQENKVLFLEMRFTTLSNSFQYLYKKLEESGEYDLKCSYVQFNFIRGREFTKRVDDMLQELATAKYVFIFFRLLQGLSGAGGVVISKSIATDLYEGRELTRFFSMLSSVQGIAPVCAPVLGGVLLEVTDWKGIFWILVLIGILLIMALAFFKESLNNEQQHCGVFATFRNYIPVFQNAQFMRYVLVQAFAMGVMFTYIAASPFIFQEHFNMSPLAYSLCFGANAIAIMLGSLTVSLFHDATDALRVGSIGFGIMSLFVAAALFFSTSVWPVEVSLFVFMLFLGVILPSSTTLALDLERKNSGNASALLGFLMFLFGGVLSPLTGLGNMLYTTGIIIVACCIGTWFCNHIATSHIALKVTKQ